ncbi:Spo0E family sporulation regulatory protein-aspartic acid phosphatase [Paenibacillus sepulcri]|uniref:Spo0E family sporulation regulatory protein-aspartic acid phosphatase n=1 Tax=Paenibacillus sepulcri TaxID=359917 RepID=A0ABS7CIC0_9BACL|nr:Spo0E family sporulation regulatory protein-aspartic acid phosphatase [Paenibacillus sepulcri]
MDNHTNHRLERLRGQLVATAMRQQTFLHGDVLLLSQTLDLLILKAQAEKSKPLEESKPV